MAFAPALHPALLPTGTVIGRWRVEDWAGGGVHGAVYRAVPVDGEGAGPVAIKVALLPRDPRMEREAELLSRLNHPSIPRLWGRGEWEHPGGTCHPYVVMEWVDGVPLYEWARPFGPSPQQVLRMSAQLASALQALHAQGAVHRDIKGANILVRRSDSRAVLTDLGSCNYSGAMTLTPPSVMPGTPAYLSPEAGVFGLQFGRDATARYAAGPADDLYALGVTACRWVTGEYPDMAEPWKDKRGAWHLDMVMAPRALLDMEPPLRDWILRLLSVRPEQRGTAAQWAEALEWAAEHSVSKSSRPSLASAPSEARAPLAAASSVARGSVLRSGARVLARLRRSWWMTAAAAVVLAMGAWWAVLGHRVHKPSAVENAANGAGKADAGTAGLGETAAVCTMEAPEPTFSATMSEETPPEPLPGQAQPDAKGRCPRKGQVALNDGCWAQVPFERDECEAKGGSIFKSTCYLPVFPLKRGPTSSPSNKQRSTNP
jgi:hypothetical protein